jgi:hypothetical protein
MLLYKDILSGDEMLSDSYAMEARPPLICRRPLFPPSDLSHARARRAAHVQESEIFYEVKGKWVVLGDIEVNIGANASAGAIAVALRPRTAPAARPPGGAAAHASSVEGEDAEELESSSKKVVDIVDAFRLQETTWDKKGFMGYIKGFMKKVAEKLSAERKDKFMAEAPAAVKMLLGKFDELQFFTGESSDLEATLCYAYYKEGESDPTFLYFKDALKEVKVS